MRIARFILALTIAAAITTSAATTKTNGNKLQAGDKLLPDDYVFAGVDGKLVQTGTDKWAFEFESAANIGGVEIKAGQTVEMLGSATLEKMILDAKERNDTMFRIWAKVAKFEGKNYLFAVYYLSLRKIDRPAEETEENEPNKTSQESSPRLSSGQAVNAPNDVVNIPPEIVALLKTSEVLPTTEAQATRQEELQLKQDTIFANRAGRVAVKNGVYVFEADAFGRGVDKFTIKLLPCQKLEDAMTQVRSESNPVRFNVAGILTKYKGEQYLLLQKATRMYSYGNFGR
ncbi:MAG: hypothetical protein ABSF37_00175 [Sedimentisphaerales bacterium]|jgi:hypothetical protein